MFVDVQGLGFGEGMGTPKVLTKWNVLVVGGGPS